MFLIKNFYVLCALLIVYSVAYPTKPNLNNYYKKQIDSLSKLIEKLQSKRLQLTVTINNKKNRLISTENTLNFKIQQLERMKNNLEYMQKRNITPRRRTLTPKL